MTWSEGVGVGRRARVSLLLVYRYPLKMRYTPGGYRMSPEQGTPFNRKTSIFKEICSFGGSMTSLCAFIHQGCGSSKQNQKVYLKTCSEGRQISTSNLKEVNISAHVLARRRRGWSTKNSGCLKPHGTQPVVKQTAQSQQARTNNHWTSWTNTVCQCIYRSKNKTAVLQLQFFDEMLTPPFRKANWHESHPSINIAVYTQHPPVNSPSSLVVSDFKLYQMGSLKMVTLFYSGTWQDDYATICARHYTAVGRVQQVYPLKSG